MDTLHKYVVTTLCSAVGILLLANGVTSKVPIIEEELTTVNGKYEEVSMHPKNGRVLLMDEDDKVWLTHFGNMSTPTDTGVHCAGGLHWTDGDRAFCMDKLKLLSMNDDLKLETLNLPLSSDCRPQHLLPSRNWFDAYKVSSQKKMIMNQEFNRCVLFERPFQWKGGSTDSNTVVLKVEEELEVWDLDHGRKVCTLGNYPTFDEVIFSKNHSEFALYNTSSFHWKPKNATLQWFNTNNCNKVGLKHELEELHGQWPQCWINEDLLLFTSSVLSKSQMRIVGELPEKGKLFRASCSADGFGVIGLDRQRRLHKYSVTHDNVNVENPINDADCADAPTVHNPVPLSDESSEMDSEPDSAVHSGVISMLAILSAVLLPGFA